MHSKSFNAADFFLMNDSNLISVSFTKNIGISATPVPFMLHLLSKGKDKDSLDFFNLEKSDDYVGVEDMKPLEIDGEPVFLELDELTKATDIPYTNEKVFALYYDALRPGAVVLDCTSPFVTASGNVKEKATAVQRKMRDEKRVDIAVVTFTGQCLSVKMPHKAWNHETYRKSLVSDLLRDIPFQTPVIIFGYSKMRRGISFRDAERVSTHMVLCLGKGHHWYVCPYLYACNIQPDAIPYLWCQNIQWNTRAGYRKSDF